MEHQDLAFAGSMVHDENNFETCLVYVPDASRMWAQLDDANDPNAKFSLEDYALRLQSEYLNFYVRNDRYRNDKVCVKTEIESTFFRMMGLPAVTSSEKVNAYVEKMKSDPNNIRTFVENLPADVKEHVDKVHGKNWTECCVLDAQVSRNAILEIQKETLILANQKNERMSRRQSM